MKKKFGAQIWTKKVKVGLETGFLTIFLSLFHQFFLKLDTVIPQSFLYENHRECYRKLLHAPNFFLYILSFSAGK